MPRGTEVENEEDEEDGQGAVMVDERATGGDQQLMTREAVGVPIIVPGKLSLEM